MKSLMYVNPKKFPPALSQIVKLKPQQLPISALARVFCQNCGLWGRAILCPPLLYETYPQFKTLASSREYFNEFDYIYLYIWKNDGTKRWWFKKNADDFAHLTLKRQKGRQLKGVEASSARYLTRLMRKIKAKNSARGYVVDAFICGHCDICARKCPNRENPPCNRGGMPSMEATGINVHKLLEQQGIDFDWPPISYLTQVTAIAVAGGK